MPNLNKYRPNVGVALFNRDGRVWFGRRVNPVAGDPEATGEKWRWQMPQGGVDAGEDFARAALRELEEETGASSVDLLVMTPGWLTYEFPHGYTKAGRIGQRQKWAAMLFRGPDKEIVLDRHTPEFDDWRWGELEEAPDLIVPFKREVYAEIVEAFRPLRDMIRGGVIS